VEGKRIRLRFLSTLKHAFGEDDRIVELVGGATVADLLRLLSSTCGKDIPRLLFEGGTDRTRNDLLILVNDTDIDVLDGIDTALSDNDEVVLMPITHGG
jgi:molybdopterin converting factor small subunit